MRIVIDIPEENYERMKFMEEMGALNNPYLESIANGTPLPEGAEILTAEAYSDLCLRASKERKTGRWIHLLNGSGNVECTECGVEQPIDSYYCPWCGAKMEGAEHGND